MFSKNNQILRQIFGPEFDKNGFTATPDWPIFEQGYVEHLARLKGEKFVQYRGLDLQVSNHVYEPGPGTSTDHLIRAMLPYLANLENVESALEMCCGCGVLSILAAQALPQAQVLAVDIQPQAVANTLRNAKINNVLDSAARISCIQSNLYANVPSLDKFDLIICNTPFFTKTAAEIAEHTLALSQEASFFEEMMTQTLDRVKGDGKILMQFSNCTDLAFLQNKPLKLSVVAWEWDPLSQYLKFVVEIVKSDLPQF